MLPLIKLHMQIRNIIHLLCELHTHYSIFFSLLANLSHPPPTRREIHPPASPSGERGSGVLLHVSRPRCGRLLGQGRVVETVSGTDLGGHTATPEDCRWKLLVHRDTNPTGEEAAWTKEGQLRNTSANSSSSHPCLHPPRLHREGKLGFQMGESRWGIWFGSGEIYGRRSVLRSKIATQFQRVASGVDRW